jgi:hypothetical protein
MPLWVPKEVADLPRFETRADQWSTHGYAFDGSAVLSWYVDRKEQCDEVTGQVSVAEFLQSDAEAKAKAWLRGLLTVADA